MKKPKETRCLSDTEFLNRRERGDSPKGLCVLCELCGESLHAAASNRWAHSFPVYSAPPVLGPAK